MGVLLLTTTAYAEAQEINFSRQSTEYTVKSADTLANFRMKAIRQDPQPANPGDYVDIYFNIDNFGGDISNPRFEFNNLKYPFSLDPSSDANEPFTTILSGQKITLHYKLKVDKDAAPGDYEVEFIAYAENINYPYFFNIKVDDVTTDFDVAMQEVTKEGLSVVISNIGKNPANAITVKLDNQEDFDLLGSSSYIIGNLNAGDYTIINSLITPKKDLENKETLNLKLQISYTDTIGNRRTLNKNISIVKTYETEKGFNAITGYVVNGDAEQTNSSSNIFKYTTIFLLVAIVSMFFYYKRKNKDDEDEE